MQKAEAITGHRTKCSDVVAVTQAAMELHKLTAGRIEPLARFIHADDAALRIVGC